jgi:DNA polymerase III epsilon subunit-like protein
MDNKYLFFDTETTGLPKNYKAPASNTENWPRMVQLAYLLYDEQGDLLESNEFIIKPDNYIIPVEVSKIHGITQEIALEKGVDIKIVMETLKNMVEKSTTLVAHNMSFDEKIIGAEFLRKEVEHKFFERPQICTMLTSKDFCQIESGRGYKWPKLIELHEKLFESGFDGAHDALADVRACARCFFELVKRGVISYTIKRLNFKSFFGNRELKEEI